MSIRTDTLNANLTRYLARYSPPRGLSDQGVADETAALLRALDRAAPQSGYDEWWRKFSDALSESMTTRAWPTVGELVKAAKTVPMPKSAKPPEEVDWPEAAKRRQLSAWLSGERDAHGGLLMRGIAPEIVTRERLREIGAIGEDPNRAIAFAADPYNLGTSLSHKDRCRQAGIPFEEGAA